MAGVRPVFARLRGEPRFAALLKRTVLRPEPAWALQCNPFSIDGAHSVCRAGQSGIDSHIRGRSGLLAQYPGRSRPPSGRASLRCDRVVQTLEACRICSGRHASDRSERRARNSLDHALKRDCGAGHDGRCSTRPPKILTILVVGPYHNPTRRRNPGPAVTTFSP